MIRGLITDMDGDTPPTLLVIFTWEDMAQFFAGQVLEIRSSDDPSDGGMGLEGGPMLTIFAVPTEEMADAFMQPLVDRCATTEIRD